MNKKLGKAFDAAVELINFVVIDYLLLCAQFSMRGSIVSVLFMASKVWLVFKFYSALQARLDNKVFSVAVVCAGILLVLLAGWRFGYLAMTLTPFAS